MASKDIALPADAEDTISSVSWSPVSDHLAAASWDGKVRVYGVARNESVVGVAMLRADGPVFDCDWAKSKDGTVILAGGADKKLHLLHAPTSQQATVGSHEAPIRGVRFVEVPGSNAPIIATGSWDKTVKFWDMRQPTPLAALACGERVYSMDAKAQLLVVATAERHVHLVDLRSPTTFLRTTESPLRHQTRAATVFPDGKGWGLASIEGRCAIVALDEKDSRYCKIILSTPIADRKSTFTFRCHREQPDRGVTKVWAVNDVQFHPTRPTVFTTAGSDGTFSFWDRVARSRLKSYSPAGAAITSTRFNRDGSLFAYAVGYDWSMGCARNSPEIQTKLMLHRVLPEESKGGNK
ncbi:hypothetical protein DL766_007854 [Monosporascus sp. MC13-8B]|uniref:Anaphase-promoting complex subunit 4 WD40 domain-containing protein n=1 Tax=Monosporascus cannonballus TaxID=155416 RepID=A0ABY0H368_9PEZI|nr:hypothetical protein DL763_010453 [Monosporascus cannonballus]RYO83289.1 hypothetical protein DL762_006198 [Monosporascus cannonballus]RYP21764.1 hypothetical protein DL766_007854 [Monosporascus sp. MC13-8B]